MSNRNPSGSIRGNGSVHGNSRREPSGFQPNPVNSGRRTEVSRQAAAQGARASSARPAQPTNSGGRSTIVRPGQPHWFGTRVDFQNGRFINTLCRCQDPNSHGDACIAEIDEWRDSAGHPTTVEQTLNRILDHCGTATVPKEEEITTYQSILR
jgi:hypothetical protein